MAECPRIRTAARVLSSCVLTTCDKIFSASVQQGCGKLHMPHIIYCYLCQHSFLTNPQEKPEAVSRKEVFQPHLPVRLPCYDLAPITGIALGRALLLRTSGAPDFHGLTGGVYKARERIHRAMADARLLANPASWSRVADSSPNWEGI